MSRYSPKNNLEALTYQLEDDVKVLRCLSLMPDSEGFKKHIKVMQVHIECWGLIPIKNKSRSHK
jgi:hypothetical protein